MKLRYAVAVFLWILIGGSLPACGEKSGTRNIGAELQKPPGDSSVTVKTPEDIFIDSLVAAAIERTTHDITYDPSYFKLDYPGGDIPPDKGVCTDVVIRSYRKVGVDLQVLVHEDKIRSPGKYPRRWGKKKPDKNIDHRRVLNLMAFFKNQGAALPVTSNPEDYRPGDLVCWNLGGNITHIGIVTNKRSSDGLRYKIVHNIGAGPQLEDVLFDWEIIGHYRYIKLK